jgi:hypothetical protein
MMGATPALANTLDSDLAKLQEQFGAKCIVLTVFSPSDILFVQMRDYYGKNTGTPLAAFPVKATLRYTVTGDTAIVSKDVAAVLSPSVIERCQK